MKLKRIIKLTALTLVMLIFVSLSTGCGYYMGTTVEGKNYGEGGLPENANQLCVAWEDKLSTIDDWGSEKAGVQGMWSTSVPITNDYGLRASEQIGGVFRKIAVLMYESVLGAEHGTDDFCGEKWQKFSLDPGDLIKKTTDITAEQISSSGGALGSLFTAIKGMAAAILIAIWAMGFISQVVNEKFSMETLLKTLMQLMCGILLITNATVIVEAFAEAGTALVDALDPGSAGDHFSGFQTELSNLLTANITVNSMGFHFGFVKFALGSLWFDFNPILVILLLVIPLVAQLMCAYKIVSIMIMRMLELTARITFAPIPIAFSAQNGFSQEAIMYFRKILACAMQPVFMLVGAACIDTIASAVMAIFGGGTASTLTGIVASFALALSYMVLSAYFGETKRLAQDIIAR